MENGCCGTKTPPAENGLKDKIRLYRPLLVLTTLAFIVALALFWGRGIPPMTGFMGMALIFLSALKFFDLAAFASAFAKYDPLAGRFPLYGTAYPFIELALGCLFLAGAAPLAVNGALISILAIGTAGVWKTIRSGVSVQCGCVGTGFSLPVGKVTLFENLVMIIMAVLNIIHASGS